MKKLNSMMCLALFGTISMASCALSPKEDSADSDSSDASTPLKIVSPAGAPSMALYTMINDDSFTTNKDATQVMAAAKTATNVDALIFDGVNALKFVKGDLTQTKWKLARWLTGGNFYIVSTKHTKEETFDPDSKILSFGSNLLPDKVFKKLASERWNWTINEENSKYESGTAAVSAVLGSDNYASYDYYFIAEPSLQAAKATLKASHSDVTVNEIYNLRTEWKEFSGMDYIPQAGLFINSETYANRKSDCDSLLATVDTNLTDAVDNPSEIVKNLNALEPDADKQASKLGFKAALVGALQKDGANRFGMIKPGTISDNRAFVNEFMQKIGESVTFAEDQFI